nr:cell wall-binding repeat-containing protein [Mobiluncus sp. Marseille-Q7826]
MNLKKKFVIGAASVALVAGMGGVAAPAAVAAPSLPGSISVLGRLAGMDRVSTSLEVAAHEFGKRDGKINSGDVSTLRFYDDKRPTRLYIVSAADANMVDAAAAGMLNDGPIAFVYNNSYVASAVGQFFSNPKHENNGFNAIEEVVAIGGEGVISDNTLKAVKDQIPTVTTTSRLGGKDRYETSVAIADYIYNQDVVKKNPVYSNRASDSGVLDTMYIANGANDHVVDSMVAGTLDDGVIVLVNADGTIPDSVAEFIKKTLPAQFSALGGAATVPDKTIQDAWVIKALANKWDSSSTIPNLDEKVKKLDWLVNGGDNAKTSPTIDMDDKVNFGGLNFVVKMASTQTAQWNLHLSNAQAPIKTWMAGKGYSFTSADFNHDQLANLQKVYGKTVFPDGTSDATLEGFLKADNESTGKFTDVNWKAIENSTAYQNLLKPAKKDLVDLWTTIKQDPALGQKLTNAAAIASQVSPSTPAGPDNATSLDGVDAVPLAMVAELAKFTYDTDMEWLKQAQAQLAELQGKLNNELDKIAPKTELRLGGADRFETAQLIANKWAKNYGAQLYSRVGTTNKVKDWRFFEAYVANGTRLADSLAAGQLTQGPILLVRGNEASAKDLPDFTKAVASNLVCWSDKTHNLSVYGIGGTGVLTDAALTSIVDQAVTGANCAVGKDSKIATTAAKLSLDSSNPDISGTATDTAKIKIDNYDADVTYTVTVSPASLKSATTGHTNEGLTFTVNRNNDEITVTAAAGAGTPAAPTQGAVIKGNVTVTVVASKAGTISGTTTQTVKVDVTQS